SAIAEAALGDAYGAGTRTTAVLIQHDARPIAQAYAPGFDGDLPQRTWSVAKSIAATLVGAAQLEGAANVTQSAGLGIDEIDPRGAITIDHLLRMASGRTSDTAGNRTDPIYWGGAAISERAADWPLIHAPGSTYRYANNDTLMAVRAIAPHLATVSPADFFAKVGMNATVAETDWRGDYVLSSQVWSTARDLARLGQLYLDNGTTRDGVRVFADDWRAYVASPAGPQPDGPFGYGAGFWLMNDSEGVPPDSFAGFGNRGQYLVIVPSRDLVIVRRGEDPVGNRFDIAAFTRDIIAALQP
ncbi:MAG: serine hydrolase, partial [Pontixanthobacter sp.]